MENHQKKQPLGLVEYYGEQYQITWEDYLYLLWHKTPGLIILFPPERPKSEQKTIL